MIAAGVTGPVPGSLGATPQLGGHAALIVTSSTPLWYITRATGVVALVLLTLGMALGLLTAVRFEDRHWPRFITIGLHRNMSLLALAFTAAHVLTTILDNFVPIDLQDAFVPFISPYRPLWLGFGAIALDLLIALTVTSLLRARLGHRSWRLVHWTAYLCWPLAVLHGLGTGTDTRTRWVLVVTLLCVVAIAGLTGWRLANGWPAHPGVRVAGAIALVAVLIAGGAWLVSGPLRPGWSLHAGLPALTHDPTGHQARDRFQAPGLLDREAGRAPGGRAAGLPLDHLVTAVRGAGTTGPRPPAAQLPRLIAAGPPLGLQAHLSRYGPLPPGSLLAPGRADRRGGAGRADRAGRRGVPGRPEDAGGRRAGGAGGGAAARC